jgi:hypothetical protein
MFLAERASEPVLATSTGVGLTGRPRVDVPRGTPGEPRAGLPLLRGVAPPARGAPARRAVPEEPRSRGRVRRRRAALVAWLLLPVLHALARSNRLIGLASLPWARFLSARRTARPWPKGPMQLLFPFTVWRRDRVADAPDSPGAFPEVASGYAGLATAVLALLALRPGRRPRDGRAARLAAGACSSRSDSGRSGGGLARSRAEVRRAGSLPDRGRARAAGLRGARARPLRARRRAGEAVARARNGGRRRRRRGRGLVRGAPRRPRPRGRSRIPDARARGGVLRRAGARGGRAWSCAGEPPRSAARPRC